MDLGDRLGWYRALADAPATPPELAQRTGSDARYARAAGFGGVSVLPVEHEFFRCYLLEPT